MACKLAALALAEASFDKVSQQWSPRGCLGASHRRGRYATISPGVGKSQPLSAHRMLGTGTAAHRTAAHRRTATCPFSCPPRDTPCGRHF